MRAVRGLATAGVALLVFGCAGPMVLENAGPIPEAYEQERRSSFHRLYPDPAVTADLRVRSRETRLAAVVVTAPELGLMWVVPGVACPGLIAEHVQRIGISEDEMSARTEYRYVAELNRAIVGAGVVPPQALCDAQAPPEALTSLGPSTGWPHEFPSLAKTIANSRRGKDSKWRHGN